MDVWYNYAHWLHSVQGEAERARALLPRATQALPSQARLGLMAKFAALEYTSARARNPELGRTMFEGLLATFPRRLDLWNQLLDHEDDPAAIRDVFDRATPRPRPQGPRRQEMVQALGRLGGPPRRRPLPRPRHRPRRRVGQGKGGRQGS